jgi:hypothetical protein
VKEVISSIMVQMRVQLNEMTIYLIITGGMFLIKTDGTRIRLLTGHLAPVEGKGLLA